MERPFCEANLDGRIVRVPAVAVGRRTVIIRGKWLKTASVKSERWVEGEPVDDPELFISKLKESGWKPDIFTFSQRLPDVAPKHPYPMEWDNVAAIPLAGGFADWWENRLPQEARKNARRAVKRGVVTKVVALNDDLLRGIVEINNETPIRQGRPFYHYGKDFDRVKQDYSTMLDRSEFIGAYFQDELIGFIQLVGLGPTAGILAFLVKNKHSDKRPANALIVKAVELCASKGVSHLEFGKFIYGKNTGSPMTEFKRRIGFEQVPVPRYFVPLTWKGRMWVKSGLPKGIKQLIPARVFFFLSSFRARLYKKQNLGRTAAKSEV
jgi:hypothetical protein